jgi:outer membrane protein
VANFAGLKQISQMKQISTILIGVLLVAVGFLYYRQFSGGSKGKAEPGKQAQATADSGQPMPKGNIAYIEIDSLHENYGYYKTMRSELDRKQKAAMGELEEKQKRLQSRYGQLQQQAASMTPQQQEAASQELNNLQTSLEKRKQELDNELFDVTNNMKKTVMKKVEEFLAEYNKDKKYDYILSYEPGLMFYKDSTLNITSEVIKGLNEREKKNKQ